MYRIGKQCACNSPPFPTHNTFAFSEVGSHWRLGRISLNFTICSICQISFPTFQRCPSPLPHCLSVLPSLFHYRLPPLFLFTVYTKRIDGAHKGKHIKEPDKVNNKQIRGCVRVQEREVVQVGVDWWGVFAVLLEPRIKERAYQNKR